MSPIQTIAALPVLVALTLGMGLPRALAAEWEPLTADLVRAEKPGFGKVCGVLVDHATGDVYVDLSDRGLYRSTDQGKTWKRWGTPPVKGRTEWPGCMRFDPVKKSKRLVMATVYGGPIAVSPDMGQTWKLLDKESMHVDWCAVDWADAGMKLILALKHEKQGLLIVSRDGGQSFAEVGKDFGPAWVFDSTTAVVARPEARALAKAQLLRTSDGARTFQPCGDYSTRALPKWHQDTLYWVVDGALLTTQDKGQTWKKLCPLEGGLYGPIFGKDARHLFVLTTKGIVETRDGGQNWTKPIPLPPKVGGALTWLEYDPKNDVVYALSMGTDLFRMVRK